MTTNSFKKSCKIFFSEYHLLFVACNHSTRLTYLNLLTVIFLNSNRDSQYFLNSSGSGEKKFIQPGVIINFIYNFFHISYSMYIDHRKFLWSFRIFKLYLASFLSLFPQHTLSLQVDWLM